MQLRLTMHRWRLATPFVIARESIDQVPVLQVELRDRDGHRGRGEAVGVDYEGETPASMSGQVEALRGWLEARDDRSPADLLGRLPAGGARNLLDAALWDLEAKRSGVSVWQRVGVARPARIASTYTIGLGTLEAAREQARVRAHFPLLKLKVDASQHLERVHAVREAAPQATLIVDANGSWTIVQLERLAPPLAQLGVALIEQPLAPGDDARLVGRRFAVPLAADESVTDRGSLERLGNGYQYVNLKLDKTGGLVEALATARLARQRGCGIMVGNMCGSSLAMAPATVLAPLAEFVDLDGPLLQVDDVPDALRFADGWVEPPQPELWG